MLQLRWRTTLSIIVSLILSVTAVLVAGRTSRADLTGQPCPAGFPAGYDNCTPAVSATLSTVVANATAARADGSTVVIITVTLRNPDGNPVPGKTVTLDQNAGAHSIIDAALGVSNQAGQALFLVKDATVETVTYTATDTTDQIAISQTVQVAFTAATVVSATLSTVVASPRAVLADNISSATITVTLKDSANNPVAGKVVALNQNLGATSIISAISNTSNANGQATFAVKDANVETVTYTAVDTTDNITLTQTVQVSFSTSTASVTPNSPYASGLNAAVVEGNSTAAAVAQAIADSSGKTVLALWELTGGTWAYFLPGSPLIDGGLSSFPGPVAGIIVVLS